MNEGIQELNYSALQPFEVPAVMKENELFIENVDLFADPETIQEETVNDFVYHCCWTEGQAIKATVELINW